jgi:peptidoglycan/LPS O-acetylase OafA/YrhL
LQGDKGAFWGRIVPESVDLHLLTFMDKPSDKIYFPGLNGLRFIAASAVIITHIELLKEQVGLPTRWHEPLFFNLGGLGVYFFFVLSGFLITYLLLAEKEKYKTISVKNFYLRRIFRIWPVYYMLILLAFFVFPHIPMLRLHYFQKFFYDDFWLKFALYFFMLPNLALAFFPSIPHAGQSWSIGVEEQFYIIWPWIVKKSKDVLRVVIIIGVAIIVFKVLILFIAGRYPQNHFLQGIKAFVAMTKMECMAIGAAGACLVYQERKKFLDIVFHPAAQAIAYILIPLLIYFLPPILQNGEHLIYSVLFLVIIINVAKNPSSFLKMENRIFIFLGNISYGLYMYHMFIVVFVLRLGKHILPSTSGTLAQVYYYLVSFLLSIGISVLSYYLYEKRFMKLKKRFTRIASGSDTIKEE